MKLRCGVAALASTLLCPLAGTLLCVPAFGEAPVVEHQPLPCTLPAQPFRLCASVTDDGQVAKARVYFRPTGDRYYSFVEMAFEGLNFCATLPAPRPGKLRSLEYYVQGIDDQYESKRSSTYTIQIQPEELCEFPPLEKDESRAKAISVYATHKKQGRNLASGFQSAGVTFVPIQGK